MSDKTLPPEDTIKSGISKQEEDKSFQDDYVSSTHTRRSDVAHYIASMTEDLEYLAKGQGLDVLLAMLSMARQQALDDASSSSEPNAS